MCMNTANVYIVLNDGLEKRVDVILTREDAPELNNYFHGDFLSADPALTAAFDGSSPYVNYNITGFEHELTIESLWAWPWDNYATCTVVERVPSITGTVISSMRNEVSPTVPTWQGRRYDITLMKSDGKWKIVGMQGSIRHHRGHADAHARADADSVGGLGRQCRRPVPSARG